MGGPMAQCGAPEPGADLVDPSMEAPLPAVPTAGTGFDPSPPPKSTKTPGGWKIWVVIALTILIVGGAVGYATLVAPGPKPTVLVAKGTGVEIPAGDYYVGTLKLGNSATLSGSLQSQDGIVVYVMDETIYGVFQSTGRTAGSEWSSSVIHNGSFAVTIGAGTWMVVFEGPNPQLPTEFLATTAVTATPSG
jgi:hypothetical protein